MGHAIAPRTALPRAVRLVTGAAAFSLLVFAILLCHAGFVGVYIAMGVALGAVAWRSRAEISAALPAVHWFFRVVFAVAGIVYFVNALAPEIQPDAAGYHLRLVADYVRLHTFSHRVGLFDDLPQGMEMLFVPAFAIGAGSAAKLVHFAFLLATIPLIREIAREFGPVNFNGYAAAAIFFLAPVCAVDGTSAYTDAGLVCACCAVVYLLTRWERERSFPLLACAALNASFCYAIKPNFGWVAIAAFVFVRFRPAFAGMVLLFSAPWLVRALRLRDVVSPELAKELAMNYSAFRPSFDWLRAPLDYTVLGGNQGLFGPAFLLLPLALLALRSKRGRVLCGLACLLAVPFVTNTGARFLMPSMALGSIAMVSVIPVPVAAGLVVAQGIGAVYNKRDWRLSGVPWEAALRIVPEHQYLKTRIGDFGMVDEIARTVPGSARIFACAALPEAYIRQEVLGFWQSKLAQRMYDALHFAHDSQGKDARLLSWRWKRNPPSAVRITALSEVHASTGSGWYLYGPGEAATFAVREGTRAADLLVWPGDPSQVRTEVLSRSGEWRGADRLAEHYSCRIDIRRDATTYIRRSSYRYLVVPVLEGPFAELGSDMLGDPEGWGVEVVGRSGGLYLFRIV